MEAENGDAVDVEADTWDDITEAPFEVDPDDLVCGKCEEDEEVVVQADGESFQTARESRNQRPRHEKHS